MPWTSTNPFIGVVEFKGEFREVNTKLLTKRKADYDPRYLLNIHFNELTFNFGKCIQHFTVQCLRPQKNILQMKKWLNI